MLGGKIFWFFVVDMCERKEIVRFALNIIHVDVFKINL